MPDISRRGDRSIRNIPVPSNHHRVQRDLDSAGGRRPPPPRYSPEPEEEGEYLPPQRKRSTRTFWTIAIVVVLLCALGGILLSTVFAGAVVTVYPRTQQVTPPPMLDARLQAPAGVLAYQTMRVERSATTTAEASGVAHVARQASGVITIYNTYSTAEQRLIANTRFEAPDGKIYRIRDSVVVPGEVKQQDGSFKSGMARATIYADSPGEEYNRSDSTRFTIPGFKGDPRYDKFYALSEEALSGGFVGDEPSVPHTELAKAQTTLKLQLDAALQSAVVSEIPDGFVAVPGTLSTTYGDITKTQDGSIAVISQSAMGVQSIIKESDLASALARNSFGNDYHGEAVALSQTSSLGLSVATSSKAQDGVLHLKFSGQGTLIWQFDPNAVKQALLGKSEKALSGVIQSFAPAITRADASIRPFWQGSFPSDPQKIQVVTGSQ